MVLKLAIILVELLLTFKVMGNELIPESWNIRHLLQSPQELERLCSVKSQMKGAFVMFNEELLNSLCDKSNRACEDIPPVYADSNIAYTCDMVVEQGLCNDPYMLRSNFCAQSCKRCEGGSCVTTIAGCKCLDSWSLSPGGEVYSGCANPDNDPRAPWCKVDTSTCIGIPDGKDIDYCDPLCQDAIDQQAAAIEKAECEAYGQECSIVCEGEENVDEVFCYGVDRASRQCVCISKSIKGNAVPQPIPVETTSLPITAATTSAPTSTTSAPPSGLKLVNAKIVGDCYDYLPSKEGTCAERVEWGSCTESWISEKFYCAVSCNLCDQQLSKEYDCLTDFQQCVSKCDGEDNMQEFACFRDLKKSECLCAKEVKRAVVAQNDIPVDDCFDYLPENEGNCELRRSWGSCDEQWMKDKNFCALTCGFCQPTAGSGVTAIGKTANLARSFSEAGLPQLTPPLKAPTSTVTPPATTSSGQIWGVITTDTNTLSVLSDVYSEMQFIEAHNAIRSAHCLPDLIWSYQLALEAQVQAEKCSPNGGAGQSVFYEQSSNATPLDVINSWYSDSNKLDYSSLPPISNNNRALYQLLWKETTTVGCGQYDCDSNIKVVVCVYDPKGNNQKSLQQNVKPPC